MGIEINFNNPDTNKPISLNIEKELTFIYGGNGTGKTTLSRQLNQKEHAVFNTDFVNKNVFVIGDTGAKCDAKNKEKFSELFLGEDAVKLAREVVDMKEKNKIYIKLKETSQKDMNSILRENSLNIIGDFSELFKKIKYEFTFDYKIEPTKLLETFKLNSTLKTSIKDDDEYEKNYKMFKDFSIRVKVRSTIEEDVVLKSIFVDEKFDFLEFQLNNYLSYMNELESLEKSFSSHGKTSEVKNWVKSGLDLHKGKSNCILCENTNINDQLNQWKERLENKHIENKRLLLNQIKDVVKSLDKIVVNKDLYEIVTEKIVNTAVRIKDKFVEYSSLISKNKFLQIKHIDIEKDDIWREQQTIINELSNYQINKHLKSLIFYSDFSDLFEIKMNEIIALSKKENQDYADKTAKVINDISTKLGFDKDIKIELDNRGAMPKISLGADNKTRNIANYSEGQRHKLALSIFFANLLGNENDYDILLLDDPVISLDVFAYHAIKVILLDKEIVERRKKLVILTHNIHYLYVQMSNILDSDVLRELTALYELTPYQIINVEPELLKFDDILLFTSLLNNLNDIEDLSLTYWLSSKIGRIFLDLKLRMSGISSKGVPNTEIRELVLPIELEEALSKKFSRLAKLCKKKTVYVKTAVEAITILTDVIRLLEFPQIFDLENLNIYDNELELPLNSFPNAKELKQEIALFAKKINFPEQDTPQLEELQNYINHPRHQITESIFGIRSSKEY